MRGAVYLYNLYYYLGYFFSHLKRIGSCLLHKPTWKNIRQETNISNIWLPWLSHTGSMTQALEQASGVECGVTVLRETWDMPWQDESEYLSIDSSCWIREVILTVKSPVIYARSIFPQVLVDRFPTLTQLGNQSLGRVIFADHTFKRGEIEIAEIDKESLLYELIPLALPEKVWARRSLFYSSQLSFLLSEVLLPYVAKLSKNGRM